MKHWRKGKTFGWKHSLTPYLSNTRLNDTQYGIRREGDNFKVANSTVTIDKMSNVTIKGTEDLWKFDTQKIKLRCNRKMACKNMRPIWRWLSLGGIITQGQLPQLSRNYIQNGMAKLFPEYKVAIRKEWVTYEHDQEILLWPRPANSVLDFEETSSRRKTQQACKEATRN